MFEKSQRQGVSVVTKVKPPSPHIFTALGSS